MKRTEAVEGDIREDYERLLRMEKRINTYPDLPKAVRAAIEHDDRLIENCLNQFHEALQGISYFFD